jgi:hypothetical protein
MKVADDGHTDILLLQALNDGRQRLGCGVIVDCNPYQLRSSPRQLRDLLYCGGDICRVSIGHRLNDDRGIPPDADIPDSRNYILPALYLSHYSQV